MSPSRTDALIIGSGISALTCAAILAKKGKSVRVLEQYMKPGGYLHCFKRFGIRFDTGAHYVGAMDEGQPFHTLLRYLGVHDPSLFVRLDDDGFDVFRFPDFSLELPQGYAATVARLCDRFPEEASAIREYFARVRQAAATFPTYEFSVTTDSAELIRALETPLAAVVRGLTSNAGLQCLLYAYCHLHGVRPEEISFGLHSLLTDSLLRGAYGLAHGGDALAEKYVGAIEAAGGEVRTKARVLRIETRAKIASAVVTANGERFEADWIISSIHPKATFQLVDAVAGEPSAFSPAFRERLARIRETDGVFGIYAACASAPDLSPRKNYHYFSSLDPADLLRTPARGENPFGAFLSPAERLPADGAASRRMALNIHATSPRAWFEPWCGSPYARRPREYEDFKAEYAEKVLGVIERLQPGVRGSIDRFECSTPLTNEHFNGQVEGSPYGIYHSIQNTGVRALGPRTHVANLLLTGQSCLFPGLLGAAISGLRTAGHVVGIKPLIAELRETGGSA